MQGTQTIQLRPGYPDFLAEHEYFYPSVDTCLARGGWDALRWPNFSPDEIASKRSHILTKNFEAIESYPAVPAGTVVIGSGAVLVSYHALDTLQALRTSLARPLILDSAYRDKAYNYYIGGASESEHCKGHAFDVSHVNLELTDIDSLAAFLSAAKAAGFSGFGLYDTFTHLDIGHPRYWDFRSARHLSPSLSAFLSSVKS